MFTASTNCEPLVGPRWSVTITGKIVHKFVGLRREGMLPASLRPPSDFQYASKTNGVICR